MSPEERRVHDVAGTHASRAGLDPRVRRTRLALQDALASLVEEGAAVTMSAIAQRAGLSRQVLHNHYGSVEQLASEVLARRLLEKTRRSGLPEDPDRALTALERAVREDGLAPFLQAIQGDRKVFRALRELAHGLTTAVLARAFAGLVGAPDGHVGAAVADADAALFIAGGVTASIDEWLRAEHAVSAVEEAARLDDFARAVLAAGDAMNPTE